MLEQSCHKICSSHCVCMLCVCVWVFLLEAGDDERKPSLRQFTILIDTGMHCPFSTIYIFGEIMHSFRSRSIYFAESYTDQVPKLKSSL